MMTKFRHAAVAMTMGCAAPAMAQSAWQDMATVDAAIAARLGAGIAEPGGAVRPADRRLRLRACAASLLVGAPANGSIMVSCPSAGWRLFVPVDGGSDPLTAVEDSPVAAASAPLATAQAGPAIRRGEQVRVAFHGAGFSIVVQARALTAPTNGRLRIRTDRGATWNARIDGDGRIIVDTLN